MTTRVGIVGAGYFGRFHFDAWSRMADCEIVAMAALPGPAVAEIAKQYSVRHIFSDAGEMVRKLDLDLVDITAPPPAHLNILNDLNGRVPWVICQKPFCEDIEQARQAADLAATSGMSLAVHENVRFQPWYRVIAGLLGDGSIGTPYQATFRLRPGDGQGADAYLDRQPYFQAMPRFLVRETAVHWIDTFRFLFGEVTALSADLHRLNPAIAGEDAGVLQMQFDSGVRAMFDGNRLADHPAENRRLTMGELQVEGSTGTLRLDGDAAIWLRAHGSNDWARHSYDWSDHLFGGDCVYLTNKAALAAFRAGEKPENSVADYMRNLELVEAAYQSNSERRWLDV